MLIAIVDSMEKCLISKKFYNELVRAFLEDLRCISNVWCSSKGNVVQA